jgi:23S rRNA (adenine2503-C2)-methyltransferase
LDNDVVTKQKPALLDRPLAEWPDLIEELGEQPFRAAQLAEWVFKKRVRTFGEMTNLPAALRIKLEETVAFPSLAIDKSLVSSNDETSRYMMKTQDDKIVSCVYLPFEERQSLCLSSQVGCAWGCVFCASGLVKLERNLTAGEIIDQIMLTEHLSKKSLDSLLFMGMGEPLANYANLIAALRVIRAPVGLNFGARHVTISTSGLVPQILKLADDAPKVNLAISLHASNDELRQALLPKSSQWPIKELMNAAKIFSKKTGSRVTFEYIILDGVNDSEIDAKRLANLVRGPAQHGDYWVNLIAYNPVPGLPFKKPMPEKIEQFKGILKSRHVPVRLRKPQGVDIGAGCGQLGEAR